MNEAKAKEEKKYYGFMNDGLFKFVFGMKSHENVAIALLNSLLRLEGNDRIKELEFLNPFNIKEYSDDKISIVDTRVKDASGKYYNIELQARSQRSFTKRFAYYLAKLYSSQLNEKEDYNLLNPAIGLAILGFEMYPDSERIDEEFVFRNKDCSVSLDNVMRMYFVDLTKIAAMNKPLSEMTIFEKWAYLLYNGNRYVKPGTNLPEELDQEESMKDAIEYAKQANADEAMRQIMMDRERYWTDRSLDHGDWYEEGRESRQPEIDAANARAENEKARAENEKARAENEKARADKAETLADEAKSDLVKIVNNMISKGKSRKEILDLTGISEAKFQNLIQKH